MKALLFLCLILSNFAFAQGVSILPNQGVKFPQYSTANMLAIASPENGSTIFNIETNTLWTYLGSAWKNIGSGVNGTKIQTFIFNSLSWSSVDSGYGRTYTASVTITEINSEILSSGTVDVAYIPYGSSTTIFRKLPEPEWGVSIGGTVYPIIKTFSYESNGITLMVKIPTGSPSIGDSFIIPQQIKVTLISPNAGN
ncbi:hypothetical protein [Emticicia sp. BO119]|uniref:hypothetical protein n=1 Tax=Emticicia sp. BO119 TaxID=2757768 RepID=UPI0015F02ABD|nr:hypothetical protein [Emticicia sp. BO119]MBA4853048.1 hypothetical protein [Emticicia sp. BO119]